MGKKSLDAILNAALDYIDANATKLAVLTAEADPNSSASAYTNANKIVTSSGWKLASVAISSADFTIAAGDTSGRKTTLGAQSSISIDGVASSVADSATHVAILDDSNSAVLYCTTCTSQSLTGGNKVNVPAWDIEFRDPS